MGGELLESSVEARVGLRLDRAMRLRLQQHVREAAGRRGIDPAAYADLVHRDAGVRQVLVDTLVVPTTSFFRHPEQFEALRGMLSGWPDPLTIWSAGCSIGAEPYSLAILLHESGRRGWRVVASDVSSAALARAASGRYEARELTGLGPERRQRFLERAGSGWRVVAELRDRITFAQHNLVTDAVPRSAGVARAVLCRNVLIYLRPQVQRTFLDRVADQVHDLDVLFLGGTESLYGLSERFVPVRVGAAYAYRRIEGAAARPGRKIERPERRPPEPRPGRRAPAPAPPGDAPPQAAWPAIAPPGQHLAEGQVALASGQTAAAVAAFRRAIYLTPEDPVAQVSLGLALDAAGHAPEARRAFAVARAVLERDSTALVAAELEGFSGDELVDLIDRRLRQAR